MLKHPRENCPMCCCQTFSLSLPLPLTISPLVHPTCICCTATYPSADWFSAVFNRPVCSNGFVPNCQKLPSAHPPQHPGAVSLPCGLLNYTAAPPDKHKGHTGSLFILCVAVLRSPLLRCCRYVSSKLSWSAPRRMLRLIRPCCGCEAFFNSACAGHKKITLPAA